MMPNQGYFQHNDHAIQPPMQQEMQNSHPSFQQQQEQARQQLLMQWPFPQQQPQPQQQQQQLVSPALRQDMEGLSALHMNSAIQGPNFAYSIQQRGQTFHAPQSMPPRDVQDFTPPQRIVVSPSVRQDMMQTPFSQPATGPPPPLEQARPMSVSVRQEMQNIPVPQAYPQPPPTAKRRNMLSSETRTNMQRHPTPDLGGSNARINQERARLLTERRQRSDAHRKAHMAKQTGDSSTDSSASSSLQALPYPGSGNQPVPGAYYEYQPLTRPRDIRILCINPGKPGDELSCELYHTEIHPGLNYDAISYAWGDRTVKAAIICNSRRLEITRSLYGALRRIRHEAERKHIWADAICINQQDIDERGHQVRLMRSIYRRARSVVIWLGPDEFQQAPAVFECARKIFAKDMKHVPSTDNAIWMDFAALFSQAWFWRLWCLQEIVLASSAEIMWGPETASWECLGFAAAWIRTVGYQILRNTPIQGVHNAYLMYALSLSSEKHDPVSFLHLLTLTRQFQVSDPRDRVYALLGLPTVDSNPERGDLFVDPDYSKSRPEVYETLARKMLQSFHGLRTLSAVQHGLEIEENLPSWVPQWDRLFTYTLAQAGRSLKNHAASGSLPASIPRFNGSSLSVDGLRFDAVTHISNVLPDSLESSQSDFEYIKTIWESMITPLEIYPDGADLQTAFCWTITAGKDWYGMLIENELEHLADFAAFQEQHFDSPIPDTETRERLVPPGIPDVAHREMMKMPADNFYRAVAKYNFLSRPRDVTKELVISTADADRFVTAMSYACRWRRFFVTQRGFMGIGPPCLREGDAVCILTGGIVPFLFRPRGETYKLVGEAYIYGIMNGEACELPFRGVLPIRSFSVT